MIIDKEEELKKEIEEIENIVLKCWFLDSNRSRIDILTGNYLDDVEFDKYNALKIELAGLEVEGQAI